ncbi:hypothetical protein ILUMI_05629 [Ignelater luminosus]|uniref:Uncharacterized protein n=1 Tax=Ignelater luminosus TaxID=2038154 RepID=A0A8K0DC76_IGNLU|nr:hypothetical protein ILUMI_05629 [Ignelater luminosus]
MMKLNDNAHARYPTTSRINENIQRVQKLILSDRYTTRMNADQLRIIKGEVQLILKKRFAVKVVPTVLTMIVTDEQKLYPVACCNDWIIIDNDLLGKGVLFGLN